MATANSTALHTGNTATIPAIDAINAVDLAMSQVEYMRDLFQAIHALAPDDFRSPLTRLAQQGQYWADSGHNELGCFREQIETIRNAG
jgi:hypothetical protein